MTTSTALPAHPSPSGAAPPDAHAPRQRLLGVIGRPQTYRNLAYLVLGLPLGTLWFSLVVTAFSVSVSLVVLALVGIPLLVGTWYLVRWCADVERTVARGLLDTPVTRPASPPLSGGPWARLRSMSRDRSRWRELAFVLLRFPVGIATATAVAVALTTPVTVALAPVVARTDDTDPFGSWTYGSRLEDVAGSWWGWALVPVGVVLLVAALHVTNALAGACGRWAERWLGAAEE